MRTTNGFLKTSMLLGFLAVLPTSGCIAPTVVGGNNDTSSSSSDTTSTMSGVSSSVGGSPATGHAVAIRAGSISGTGGGSMTSVVSVGVGGSGGGMDAVAVVATGSGVGGMSAVGGAGGGMSGSGGAPMTSGVGGAPPDMTSGVGGGNPGWDPETLFLEIDSNPITCEYPNSLVLGGEMCVSGTHLHIELPPAAQQVGVYHFNDGSGVTVFGEISLPDCGGGGGNFFDEVRVLSVTATAITVQVTGAISTEGFDPNGLYIVPRCEPVEAPPTQGIAIIAANIPSPGSTTTVTSGTGGAPPSMTDIVLILHDEDATNVGAVCADPYGNDWCTMGKSGWEVSVTLPQMYQVPGTYSLDDPNLNASYGEWQSQPMDECSGGGGSFWGGTLEVVSVDLGTITAKFHGMLWSHPELAETTITYARCEQN